jgi:hypothetical protein
LVAEIWRAEVVMVRTGRRIRPATSQPSTRDTADMRANAATDRVRNACFWLLATSASRNCAACSCCGVGAPSGDGLATESTTSGVSASSASGWTPFDRTMKAVPLSLTTRMPSWLFWTKPKLECCSRT